MSYLVMARKYRPQRFEDVVDQDHVTRTLRNAIENQRMAHAILLTGPRGTGKTTVARILAKAMNCETGPTPAPCNRCDSCVQITAGNAVDVYEIDGASNNSVDQIRELRDNIQYMPAHSPHKIYIIDEVHMLSTAAFNALLKTLEEPPAHVMFIFATTEPQKIPVTILSRCQRHDFRRIDLGALQTHLSSLCRAEEITADAESLFLIAREAGGSMRDALSLLDQVIACSKGTVDETLVYDVLGVIDRKRLYELSESMISGDAGEFLDALDDLYDRGQDVRKLYTDLVEYFRNLKVIRLGRDAGGLRHYPAVELELLKKQADKLSMPALDQILQTLFRGEPAVRLAPQPRLAMEMVVLRLMQTPPSLPIETLIEQIRKLRNELDSPTASASGAGREAVADNTGQEGRKAKTPPAPSSPETGSAAPTIESLPAEGPLTQAVMHEIQEAVAQRSSPLGAALSGADFTMAPDGVLVISIPGNGFQVKMVQRKKNMTLLADVISQAAGKKLNIQIRSKASESAPPPGVRKENDKQVRKEALNHPIVAEVLEIFNGRITDVTS